MENNSHIISGVVFSHTNSPDKNGRIYPREAMKKAVDEYLFKIRITQRKQKLEKIEEIYGKK